jgi:hypothetical protein
MTVVLGVIGVAGVVGYCVGGTVMFASSLVVATTVLLPTVVERALGTAIAELFGTSGVLNRILTISFACVALSLVAMLVAEVVWNRLMEKRLRLMVFHRSLGLFLGATQAAVICLGILGGSLVAQPYARSTRSSEVHTVQDYLRHCTADAIARVSAGTRESQIYPLVNLANPFDRLPSLRGLSMPSRRLRTANDTPQRRNNRPK